MSEDYEEPETGDVVELLPNVRLKMGAVPVPGQRHHEDIGASVWVQFVGSKGSVLAATEVELPYHALRKRKPDP
ncbi:MAG: hypothetical protein WCB19_07430 [Thermoplasmata archaeon]